MELRRFFFNKIIGKKLSKRIIDNIFFFSGLSKKEYFEMYQGSDLLTLLNQLYNNIGIGYNENRAQNDEEWFIENILMNHLSKKSYPIIFDVGANKGQYLKILGSKVFNANIFSFEPNPYSFKLLEHLANDFPNSNCFNIAFGKKGDNSFVFTPKNDLTSELASLESKVFMDLHNILELESFPVEIQTIDGFCERNEIEKIDFLKIDTEGGEYDVLLGAKRMITEKRIETIQFEFNEMNIISKIFLKDFYDLLDNYEFL